ncbi:MAG: GtrA family protein [Barnesiella sp.]|nr:GtrA family protein [Bacteroidales bacterium]MBD5246076.1 GtrA family protein [Barnesiella sp.]MBD5249414.1 GtrA family protein [Barnesiella sp.]
MQLDKRRTLIQFTKYAMVGVMNTLVTLILIFIFKTLFGVNEYVSNAIGYVGGLINSFIWNKTWVFQSKRGVGREAIKFIVGFLICYGLQLLAVWVLNEHSFLGDVLIDFGFYTVSGYAIATLIGMALYTLLNFIYNRLVTFRV